MQRGSGSKRSSELEARVTFRALRAPNYSGFPSVTEYPARPSLLRDRRTRHLIWQWRQGVPEIIRSEQNNEMDNGTFVIARSSRSILLSWPPVSPSFPSLVYLSPASLILNRLTSGRSKICLAPREISRLLRRLAQLNGDIMRDGDSIKPREREAAVGNEGKTCTGIGGGKGCTNRRAAMKFPAETRRLHVSAQRAA